MGLHWDSDKRRSDAYYENIWAAERAAKQEKENRDFFAILLEQGKIKAICSKDELASKCAGLKKERFNSSIIFAIEDNGFAILQNRMDVVGDFHPNLLVNNFSISTEKEVFIHDDIVYVKSSLDLSKLIVGVDSSELMYFSTGEIVCKYWYYDPNPMELYSTAQKRIAALEAQKELDAQAEAQRRADLVANGYKIETHYLYKVMGRKCLGQHPLYLVANGTLAYKIEASNIPEAREDDFIVLSYSFRNAVCKAEIAIKQKFECMSKRNYEYMLEDQEHAHIRNTYHAAPPATVSGKDSPFAALAALKKG